MTNDMRFCAILVYLCCIELVYENKKSKKISILVLEGCTPMAPVSAMEIFQQGRHDSPGAYKSSKPFF